MTLFKLAKNKASKLSIVKVAKEKDIQGLFENNLDTILNLTFLATEYSTSFGGRIDTLAIDNNGAPVIIEYKRNQNDNVINQGLSYLKWLLDHKAEFEKLCDDKNIKLEIDWSSPRVVCIAESYNKFDLDTVEILPLKVELFEYKLYEDNLLELQRESQKEVKISTSKIFAKTKKDKEGYSLQKDYSIESHFQRATKEIKELYSEIKERIISLDDSITEDPRRDYIAFKLTTNFADIVIQKEGVKIYLNMPSGKLKDSKKLARDLAKPKKIGHWGNGDYEVKVTPETDLDYIFGLIQQSYEFNK